ncbi:SUKH-4 family immunity protein [Nocardia beijingensis]|uniref:SUKH-4 family immunity protein n=1 Tax=Nocardia beijingensis TaxID=95162 RepID=UPI001471F11C|nr:SUKH-4 family immunity protein [Nocardia beijingensis]
MQDGGPGVGHITTGKGKDCLWIAIGWKKFGRSMPRVWEYDNLIGFPRDQWIEMLSAPVESYPDVNFLPVEMSVVYTAQLDGEDFELFDQLNLRADGSWDEVLSLLVIGAVPAAPGSMLFGFDVTGGRVVLLGVESGTLELVNSSFRALTEFLYHYACFIDEDTGPVGRAARATTLQSSLVKIDPGAFASRESWWSIALSKLGAPTFG